MPRLRPSFVITMSALTTACGWTEHTHNPPPLEPVHNPPAPEKPQPLTEGATVNPRDGEGRVIYRNVGQCWVELPFDGPVVAVVAPPKKDVPCPPAMMADKAWEECAAGSIVLEKAGPPPTCQCMVFGNPPPPPRGVSCPEDVKGRTAGATP